LRAAELCIALIATIFSTVLVPSMLSALGNKGAENIVNYVVAKCPGIPGGSGSGGPDYINIALDAVLAIVFVAFLYLTIRDMRRKRKRAENSED
jgi:hypothetical protein